MSLCPDSNLEPGLPGKLSSSFSPTTIGAVEVIVGLVLITPLIKTPSAGKTASAPKAPKPCEVSNDVPAPPPASSIGFAPGRNCNVSPASTVVPSGMLLLIVMTLPTGAPTTTAPLGILEP